MTIYQCDVCGKIITDVMSVYIKDRDKYPDKSDDVIIHICGGCVDTLNIKEHGIKEMTVKALMLLWKQS